MESCDGEEGEEEKVDKGKDEGDKGGEEGDGDKGEVDGRTPEGGSSGSLGMGTHPFILFKMWTVNDFKPTMAANIFKNLRDCYQIPDHIPIRLPRKFENCYSGKTTDVGMYDAIFTTGLRLPLMILHH